MSKAVLLGVDVSLESGSARDPTDKATVIYLPSSLDTPTLSSRITGRKGMTLYQL